MADIRWEEICDGVVHAKVGLLVFVFELLEGGERRGRLSMRLGNDYWKCEDFPVDTRGRTAPIEEASRRVNLMLAVMKESLS